MILTLFNKFSGHTVHEWTSHTSIDAIFNFFKEERKTLGKNK